MILLVDNYDSFTYNIYQYVADEFEQVTVVRNDTLTLQEIDAMDLQGIIISPGPGLPNQAGICLDLVREFYKSIPILGICLGQQVIAEALGGELRLAKEIKHGKTSLITHLNQGILKGLENPVEVMRYHSYVVDDMRIPEELDIIAKSIEDDEIMAIGHKQYPVFGVQFHPESIGTATGKQLIHNFLAKIREENSNEKLSGKIN
ncbi:aminodeoxychorismate/anthranilate synthase component II [Oceanobacillus sp. 143]|uniref:Aminodeoxychorismate/anthranilate synthase component II n=1 Tax=Oceanobacillus zhaokaii TaxID=2052660 RepID=A0A345PD52_9BACI|nr:aminodeoxychorismate/anthranilate synthase component II [Oceanobacillus zhaokaii]AXI07932.1 aminodeoxychorismate/anthranilate synthase component II [Oceanobacillus zhaokaii]QGS67986.1 aminodeoxychorismate/anthranilate synthase component II [Oceanobacillus sp. 143]